MASPEALSDAELREELMALGANVGPITSTTRSIYEKQLVKRRAASTGNTTSISGTKTRSASKSPSRVSRRTVTTSSVEVVRKRTPNDRRVSKSNRSEPEDEFVAAEVQDFEDEGTNDVLEPVKDMSTTRITRSFDSSASHGSPSKSIKTQEVGPETTKGSQLSRNTPSYGTSIPQNSPTKKPTTTIYPGLSTPLSIINPSPVSKLSERIPTPPRITKLNQESSILSQTATNRYGTAGVFSDITADFSSQPRKRPIYAYASNERSPGSSFLRDRVLDDEPDYDDEDDDHMESSRIITPEPTRGGSFISSMSHFPSYAYGAMAATFKKNGHFGGYRTDVGRSHSLVRRNGSDVANFLLYTMGCMFLFLLLGYIGIVHSEKVINAGVIIAGLAKETFAFVYMYAVLPSIVVGAVCGAGMLLYILNQRLLTAKAERKKRVFDLVEKITEIIRKSAAEGQEYIAEPHIRDMLIPPSQRMKGSAEWRRWQEAIDFINQNDSRVSTESRIINGVECAVWRWVPANKVGWQGSAFDGRTQLNVPDQALSHCLKLRGMFVSSKERGGADIERALVQKLSPIRPLHIHVENGSKDGVVFARFATLPDCKAAFTALHGSWFNGELVSAKYLRDERYEQRFPSAPRNTSDL